MTDKDAQEPIDAQQEADLASQLDDLLREVSEWSQAESAPQAASDAPAAHTPADPPTANSAAAPQDDLLVDQIQELLDEAKAMGSPKAAAEIGGSDQAAQAPASATDEPSIHQIDEMLADDAEAAFEGGFESFDEVMGTSAAHGTTPAPPASQAMPTEAHAFPSPDQVVQEEAAAPLGADDLDDELSGEFATADDVAEELDRQPELAVEPTPRAAAVMDGPTEPPEPAVTRREAGTDPLVWVDVASEPLRRLCAIVNRPMGKLPLEFRNTVGYIGLFTLANAMFLLIYGLIF